MAKATKLKSGNWRCKAYYVNEQGMTTSKSFTAGSKKAAEIMAREFSVNKEHKKLPVNRTVKELA